MPLQELLKREEEAENAKKKDANLPLVPASTQGETRKAKGLSIKAPSFLFKKKATLKKTERNIEEKEDE